MTDTQRDLLDRAMFLAEFVKANAHPESPIGRAFANVPLDMEHRPGTEPPDEELRAAVDAYESLPPAEKAAIFNGWVPSSQRLADAERTARLCARLGVVVPVLMFQGYSDELYVHRDDAVRNACPVRVEVMQGTSAEEVLGTLRRVMAMVESQWGEMTADPGYQEWPIDERDAAAVAEASANKSGPRKPAPVSSLGSSDGKQAESRTASAA